MLRLLQIAAMAHPHYHNLSPNKSLLLHIFEPLVKRDANQKLVPGLATSWKALDDLT